MAHGRADALRPRGQLPVPRRMCLTGNTTTRRKTMDFEAHPACNHTLRPPPGWDQETLPCASLPVRASQLDGLPVMESFWRPSPQELEALNARGYVVLQVLTT